jgi:glycosyltransferase involved in cell wall biosynthesis
VRSVRGLRTVVTQARYWPSLRQVARADVVHAFSASYWSFLLAPVPAMLAGRLTRRRVLLHYHSGEAGDHLERWGWLVHPWLRLAHEVIVPSEYLRAIFARHGVEASVIPNIVDLSEFPFRDRHPIGPKLLSVRTLEPPYGVRRVLEAFERVKRARPDATLTIAGDGSERPALMALARHMGGVEFVGAVAAADMPRLYAGADIFLNATHVDNQPVSILEAFASGLPVVTSDAGDIPQMVRDGETGCLVPGGAPDGLATRVLELIEKPDDARRLAHAARDDVRRFTWEAVRHAWSRIYAEPPSGDIRSLDESARREGV